MTQSPNYTSVRVVFDPYSHGQVQTFLKSVIKDFGPMKQVSANWITDRTKLGSEVDQRWFYIISKTPAEGPAWALDFCFLDPRDATLFGLKYSL